jgi:hypothetical protein
MKKQAYTYKTNYGEKTVDSATMFDINTLHFLFHILYNHNCYHAHKQAHIPAHNLYASQNLYTLVYYISRNMMLPVLDNKNKAMKKQAYTYKTNYGENKKR